MSPAIKSVSVLAKLGLQLTVNFNRINKSIDDTSEAAVVLISISFRFGRQHSSFECFR